MKKIILLITTILLTACSSMGQNTPDSTSRTAGTFVDDKTAIFKIGRNLKEAGLTNGNHINTTVYNSQALLSGEISNESQKQQATEAANKDRHVRKIFNQLIVSAPTSFTSRLGDSAITGSVKTALLRHPEVRGNRVKVVTENGTVFLMGLVTEQEANSAVSTIRTIRGVKKVVRLFEIVNNTPVN